MQDDIEEFKKIEEKKLKKKIITKRILIISSIILILVALYTSTIIVKKINISKLGNDYCQYNGEHPIQTGSKDESHSSCRGCSKIMKFERTVIHELCDTCAKELNRCKICGKLLEN